MGILIPCVAKHLLRWVLSTTPGNLFAEYTTKLSEKQDARTGARPVLTVVVETFFPADWPTFWTPTFTNEKRSLETSEPIRTKEGKRRT